MVYCVMLGKELTVLYTAHSSYHTIIPVAAEQSSTAQTMPKAGVTDVSTIPNTQYGFAGPQRFCGFIICMH